MLARTFARDRNPRPLWGLAFGLLLLILVPGCSPSTPSPAPSLTGLTGRLVLRAPDSKYYQIDIQKPAQAQVAEASLKLPAPPPGMQGGISPEGHFGLMPSGNDWLLVKAEDRSLTPVVDRETGTRLKVVDRECTKAWSTDGQWVAVLSYEGLYLAGTDGKASLFLPRRKESYAAEKGGDKAWLYAQITCPAWLGPDKLMLDHYKGSFPERFTGPKNPISGLVGTYFHSALDTTSVLTIAPGGAASRDLDTAWKVELLSYDFQRALLRVPPWPEAKTGKLYLAAVNFLVTGEGTAPMLLEECTDDTQCSRFAFSPDSRRVIWLSGLATTDKTKHAPAFQLSDAQPLSRVSEIHLTNDQEPQSDLYWSPSGKTVAFSRGWNNKEIYILDLEKRTVALLGKYTFELGADLVAWID